MRSAQRLATNIGSWLPGSDNRDNQYRAGYRAGFEDKVRTIQTTTLPEATMPNATSFAHQIDLLVELNQYLGDFQERLMGVSANYQRKVDALHQAGMMDETYYRYVENELAQTQALIAKLVEHISANDMPRVRSETAYLEQKL
jgi:hypothetical protein